MAEDLVTLGFAFSAGNAETEINKLISAFNTLDEKSQTAQKSLGKLFGGSFVSKIDLARKSIGKFNSGLVQTANFAKKTASAIKPLPTQIGKITTEHLKPIPPEVLQSLSEYSRLVREAADAVSKLNVNAKSVKATPVIELNNAMRDTGRHAEDLGESIYQMFRTGTLAAFFKKSTEMAVAFGVELAHVNSLTLEFDSDRIRSGLLNLSSVYGSATKNAEALYYAYSSGVRGSEADLVHFTQEMAGLSTLIRANVTQTVDAATSAMNAYNLSARDAGQLTDLFYGIVKQGKARGEQLASGLGQVISTAATAGLSLDEMGASIASLTKVMQTRNAITYFNNMLSKMIKPTKECRLAAEKLGIELGLDALRAKGFAGMMQEIHDKTRGSQQAILNLFPDLRGQRAALQLLNKGWGDFQNQLQFFANKSGIADKAMQELTGDIYFQLSKIPDTVGKIKIATGDLMVQILTLGGALTPLITAFNNMGETGQKVVGAMVLIAGGLALVKTSKKIHMAMSLLEMKYNAILSGQRREEVAERTAVAAAITKETAARKGAAAATVGGAGASTAEGAATAAVKKAAVVNAAAAMAAKKVADANLLRAKSELVTAQNIANSTLMTKMDTAAKISGLNASVWHLSTQKEWNAYIAAANAHEIARIRLLAASKAAIDAETASLAANAAAQKARNAASAYSATNTIADVARTGVGFAGGFKAMFDTASFMKKFSTSTQTLKTVLSGLRHPWTSFVTGMKALHSGGVVASLATSFAALKASLSVALTGIGAVLGKVATIAASIFSAANVIIAGLAAVVIGAVDMIQSLVRTGDAYKGSFVLQPIADWIYGIGKLAEAAKEMDKHLADALQTNRAVNAARTFVKDIQNEFTQQFREQIVIPKLNVQGQINENFKPLSKLLVERVEKFDAVTLQNAQDQAISTGLAYRNYQMKMARHLGEGKTLTEHNKQKLEALKSAWDAANENLNKLRDGAEQNANGIRSYVQKIDDLVQAQYDAIDSIWEMQESVRYKMMTPSMQMTEQRSRMTDARKEYYEAIANGDAKVAKKAFKKMISAYDALVKDAEAKLKSYGKLRDTLKGDALDYLLKATQSLPQKLTLLRNRAAELYLESGGRWIQNAAGQWNFQVPTGVNSDLAKSYEKAKQAAGLQIQALQEEIKAKQKLAQAEKRANDNTVKLIQSMDKFKATTASAVNAYSLEAQQLQSRKFVTPAKVQPVTVAQSGLGNSQNQLNTLYQQLAAMTTAYQNQAAQREAQAQQQRNQLNKNMEKFMDNNEKLLEKLDANTERMHNALLKLAEAMGKGMDMSKLAAPLKNLEKTVGSLGVVTY